MAWDVTPHVPQLATVRGDVRSREGQERYVAAGCRDYVGDLKSDRKGVSFQLPILRPLTAFDGTHGEVLGIGQLQFRQFGQLLCQCGGEQHLVDLCYC